MLGEHVYLLHSVVKLLKTVWTLLIPTDQPNCGEEMVLAEVLEVVSNCWFKLAANFSSKNPNFFTMTLGDGPVSLITKKSQS